MNVRAMSARSFPATVTASERHRRRARSPDTLFLSAHQAYGMSSTYLPAFPTLSENQVERLAAYGTERPTEAGEVLFRAGDSSYDFFLLLEGKVAIVDQYQGPEERLVVEHHAGRFLGEYGLLTGQEV